MRRITLFALAVATASLAGCAGFPKLNLPWPNQPEERGGGDSADGEPVLKKETIPASPMAAPPLANAGSKVWTQALNSAGLRIVISTEHRALWLLKDSTLLFGAPVAVGMSNDFVYNGKKYDFDTPRGRRTVKGKGPDPLWAPPDWHYFEIAAERNLKPVYLRPRQRVPLSDGGRLEVTDATVYFIDHYGHPPAEWSPGRELIFDGKIFIPPHGFKQRRIPLVLGPRKLELGDGYLIHGTDKEDSIGQAVSHGCVRMYNDDVTRLYDMVPIGTAVFIY